MFNMKNIKNNIESDEIIWSSIKLQLKDTYGEAEYSNWLKLLTFSKVEKEIIIFYAPTKFMCDWINSHYGKKILSLWREFDKLITDISIVVCENKISTETTTNKELQKDNPELNKNTKSDLFNNLDPRFTFKNFILQFLAAKIDKMILGTIEFCDLLMFSLKNLLLIKRNGEFESIIHT